MSPAALVYFLMAINFKNIKDPKLGLLDKITFGKLKGCRVCDVIEDYYDYLIWAEKQGYIKLQPIVIETIQNAANFQKEESAPIEAYEDASQKLDAYDKLVGNIPFEDVPF